MVARRATVSARSECPTWSRSGCRRRRARGVRRRWSPCRTRRAGGHRPERPQAQRVFARRAFLRFQRLGGAELGGGLTGGVGDSVSVGEGVTFGEQVAGNGNGVNVQIGVGEPTVQVGHGRSIVGGLAIEVGAPGPCGLVMTTIGGMVGLSSAFLMPCSAWAWPVPMALRLCLPMRPRKVVLLAMSTWMSTCSSVRVVGPQAVTAGAVGGGRGAEGGGAGGAVGVGVVCAGAARRGGAAA